MSALLKSALALALKGLPIFPCNADKKPITPKGFKAASTDAQVVTEWWIQHPAANIALRTGACSGLVVLDVDLDVTKGVDGETTLAALLTQHGPLPETLTVKTPRGGRHIYFQHQGDKVRCSTGKLGAGLDVRGDGGYVLLPPSRTYRGRYEYTDRAPVAPPPAWLQKLMTNGVVRTNGLIAAAPVTTGRSLGVPASVAKTIQAGADEGTRNATAFHIACQLRDEGQDQGAVEGLVLQFGAKCRPPMPEAEIRDVVASAFTSPPRVPAKNPNVPGAEVAAIITPSEFPAYYDAGRRTYWIMDSREHWIEVTETSVRRNLRATGYSPRADDGFISPVDKKLIELQHEHDVAFAGPLAGHLKGVTECCGHRILITESPRLVVPTPGNWPNLDQLIRGLLLDENCDQSIFLKGWLKYAVEAQRAFQIRPGQVLVIAGPRDSGKSLLQNLITEILGGRAAKPYRYMSGVTPFNGELFGAEHLLIEDEFPLNDIRSRRQLGSRIKDFTVNELQSHHAKYRQAISLKPFWRVSVTLNDEPENLHILPPLDESLIDKIILLKAHKRPMPMPTQSLAQRKAFWAALVSELPAFLHYLQELEIPETLQSERFGVTHYHHPHLLAALDDLSPELRLLVLIDGELFDSPAPSPWEGSADQLERKLREGRSSGEVSRLLTFNTACAVYLGRLHQKFPDRIHKHRDAAKRTWTLLPPPIA